MQQRYKSRGITACPPGLESGSAPLVLLKWPSLQGVLPVARTSLSSFKLACPKAGGGEASKLSKDAREKIHQNMVEPSAVVEPSFPRPIHYFFWGCGLTEHLLGTRSITQISQNNQGFGTGSSKHQCTPNAGQVKSSPFRCICGLPPNLVLA